MNFNELNYSYANYMIVSVFSVFNELEALK